MAIGTSARFRSSDPLLKGVMLTRKSTTGFDSATSSRESSKPPDSATMSTSPATEGENPLQQQFRGIPRMPEDGSWGNPFNCTVCGETLHDIRSYESWA